MKALTLCYLVFLTLAVFWLQPRNSLDQPVGPSHRRCPSNVNLYRECWLRLRERAQFHKFPNESSLLLRAAPPKGEKHISQATYNFFDHLRAMDLPIYLISEEYLTMSSELQRVRYALQAVNLQFGDHAALYRSFPGGAELYQILTSKPTRANSAWKQLETWVSRHIPGYRIEKVGGDEGDGFINEVDFFKALHHKLILIGNHHDLISHLIQFADPRIRALTERIAAAYVKARGIENSYRGIPGNELQFKLRYILNSLWAATQENTPVLYSESDERQALAIIGGFPTVKVPDYLSQETLHEEVHYFSVFADSANNNPESMNQLLQWLHPYHPELARQFAERWIAFVKGTVTKPEEHRELAIVNPRGERYPFGLEEESTSFLDESKPWRVEFDERIFNFAFERARTEFETLHPQEMDSLVASPNYARLMRTALATELRERASSAPSVRLFTPEVHSEMIEIWLSFIEQVLEHIEN